MVATGQIQEDGTFTLTTHYVEEGQLKTRPGALAGEHLVSIRDPVPANAEGPRVRPLILSQKYHIETKENVLVIETPRVRDLENR
jgi:hypothetical protein